MPVSCRFTIIKCCKLQIMKEAFHVIAMSRPLPCQVDIMFNTFRHYMTLFHEQWLGPCTTIRMSNLIQDTEYSMSLPVKGHMLCTMTLNIDLLIQKFNVFISLLMTHHWCKFGRNSSNSFRDIMSTIPKSAVSSIYYSTKTLTFDLLSPKYKDFISVSLM